MKLCPVLDVYLQGADIIGWIDGFVEYNIISIQDKLAVWWEEEIGDWVHEDLE